MLRYVTMASGFAVKAKIPHDFWTKVEILIIVIVVAIIFFMSVSK